MPADRVDPKVENLGVPPFFALFYKVVAMHKDYKQINQCRNCPFSTLTEMTEDRRELCSFTLGIVTTLKLLFEGIIERNQGQYQIDMRLVEGLNIFLGMLDDLRNEIEGFPV